MYKTYAIKVRFSVRKSQTKHRLDAITEDIEKLSNQRTLQGRVAMLVIS